MEKNSKQCFQCGGANGSSNTKLFAYTICTSCESKLGLFQDKTIAKYISSYQSAKEKNLSSLSYAEEIQRRLVYLEKDYIKKRIKLLSIQDRIKVINAKQKTGK